MREGGVELRPRDGNVLRSEAELERELEQARIIDRVADGGESGSVDIRNLKAPVGGRCGELRVVEEIENFSAEIEAHVLPRQLKLFDQ